MEAVAIGALVGGTALQATSQIMMGREQSRAAAFEQEQLQIQEQMTRTAAAQDETRRRDELTANCQQNGLNLRLHHYKGRWRIGFRGIKNARLRLVLNRDQCHLGVCKTTDAAFDIEQHRDPDLVEAAAVE